MSINGKKVGIVGGLALIVGLGFPINTEIQKWRAAVEEEKDAAVEAALFDQEVERNHRKLAEDIQERICRLEAQVFETGKSWYRGKCQVPQ